MQTANFIKTRQMLGVRGIPGADMHPLCWEIIHSR